MNRRDFLQKSGALGAAGLSLSFAYQDQPPQPEQPVLVEPEPQGRLPYTGPNVILVRFGGGVRRRETIDFPENTYCPFIYHDLYQRQGGVLFPKMEIESLEGCVKDRLQTTLQFFPWIRHILKAECFQHLSRSQNPNQLRQREGVLCREFFLHCWQNFNERLK